MLLAKQTENARVDKCALSDDPEVHSAVTICSALASAVEGRYVYADRTNRGLFNQIMTNLKGGYSNNIVIKSGKYRGGVSLPLCPFCGEKLMTDAEREKVKYQIEMELDREALIEK
jgi:hypothetical protein